MSLGREHYAIVVFPCPTVEMEFVKKLTDAPVTEINKGIHYGREDFAKHVIHYRFHHCEFLKE